MLGDWCATLTKDDEQSFVIVVNIHSLLTIVVPLCPPSAFPRTFKVAVRASLEDLNVDTSAVASEISSLEALQDTVVNAAMKWLTAQIGQ